MKKFVVMEMGPRYNPEVHRADLDLGDMVLMLRTVRDFEEAKTSVDALAAEGVGCIELCGAFGEARARELIERTGGKIAIGYGANFAEQQELFAAFFRPGV